MRPTGFWVFAVLRLVMRRPTHPTCSWRVVSFKIPAYVLEELDRRAKELRLHRSELIRRIICEYLGIKYGQ